MGPLIPPSVLHTGPCTGQTWQSRSEPWLETLSQWPKASGSCQNILPRHKWTDKWDSCLTPNIHIQKTRRSMGANPHVHRHPSLHLCMLRAPLEGAGRNHPFSLCLHSRWAGLGGVEILCRGWGGSEDPLSLPCPLPSGSLDYPLGFFPT